MSNIEESNNSNVLNVEADNFLRSSPVFFSEKAICRMFDMLSGAESDVVGFRIKVVNKGCAGNEYKFEYLCTVKNDDEVIDLRFERKICKVALDPISLFKMLGSEVDYVETKFGSEFVFNNPCAKDVCACGKSFSTDKVRK